jgi:glucose/mannose-6-phosphate isomerase
VTPSAVAGVGAVRPEVLDDAAALGADGARTMLALAAGLGPQLREGYRAGRRAEGLPEGDGVLHVVVAGMGGSGVAGDMLRGLFAGRIGVPIAVVKGYTLPEFCGRSSVVLAVSFSGNTEETLSAYAQAVGRGCRVVAISAGGELASLARHDDVPHVSLRADIPMPRAALGNLTAVPLGVLEAMGLVPHVGPDLERAARLVDGLAERLGPDRPAGQNRAKALAAWIGSRTPVVWGSEGLAEAAALRWKSQVNENAKGPAFWAWFPELDHNDVEGWSAGAGLPYAGLVLRHHGEHHATAARVAATLEAIAGAGLEVAEVEAEGSSPFEWLFSLVMLGDFATTYLGVLRGHDPFPIPVLTSLKERLRR